MKSNVKAKEKLSVGDTVSWSSQAAGVTKTKTGKVVLVVPGYAVAREAFRDVIRVVPFSERPKWADAKMQFDGVTYRGHESYVVYVLGVSGRGKGKLYWPRASQLEKK